MRLKHQHARQPAHPINVSNPLHAYLNLAPRRLYHALCALYFVPCTVLLLYFFFPACPPRANSPFPPCSACGPCWSPSSFWSRQFQATAFPTADALSSPLFSLSLCFS